jgi:hypothetical protein
VLAIALLLASAGAQAEARSAPLATGVAPLVSDEIVAGECSKPELEATLSGRLLAADGRLLYNT